MRAFIKITSGFVILFCLFQVSCNKDEKKDEEESSMLQNDYTGYLTVRYSNVYPPWDVSTNIDVNISKEMETILFESGTLSYSGDTIIGNDDSRIVRSGSWQIQPVGFLEKAGDDVQIEVDGGVSVVNDVQKIYAKNPSTGQWQLVFETDISAEPNADLVFSLQEAETTGSTIAVNEELGSIVWTLNLLPAIPR